MYISLNWLKDFVSVPGKITPTDIAQRLTAHTAEVEGFVIQADQFNKVVVGRVLEVKKHPNADRLRLVLVDVKSEKLDIVCGAPNVAEGQLVPVALVGAVLPGGLEIKASEIRGEKSNGMICAEDELGLGQNHEGIMVLKDTAKPGDNFAKYLKAEDTVFELDNKSLSNRSDLLSHYGIARELAAIFDLKLNPVDKLLDNKMVFSEDKQNALNVKIEDKKACLRYLAVKIDNIEIKESPAWLKDRLVAVNQRPINNIVDLTNYVMFELGQPLHAFTADTIDKIVVRLAASGEKIKTLDEKERILSNEDLVISDGQNSLAIAGIMGGKNSGITPSTTSIILESANFNAQFIRKTSQKLGLRSESSTRFEKSLDPLLTEVALKRFLSLLKKVLPKARIASPLTDVNNFQAEMKEIILDLDWLDKKIGQAISENESMANLKKLGFGVEKISERSLKVLIPSWRATKDVAIKEDLAEEILRLHGYDNIVSYLPQETLACPVPNHERLLERRVKNFLALKYSLNEVYNYSFVGKEQLKKLNIDFFKHLRLTNPSSENHTMLRQSLVPNLISNVKVNQARLEPFGFFEIGSVFLNAPGELPREATGLAVLPYQEKRLGIIVVGENQSVFDKLKSIVSGLTNYLFGLAGEPEFLELSDAPGWTTAQESAKINVLGREIGFLGLASKKIAANVNLKRSVAVLEINFSELLSLVFSFGSEKFQEPARYPAIERDLAFVLDKKILYNEFRKEIARFNSLIERVELFDIYSGENLSDNEKSLAFHLSFRSPDRTLNSEEIDALIKNLLDYLREKFNARLR